ncbi:MAG: hypothetical protein IPL53_21530 [Ignavibacteria bacterium]|nr:hypothetical protein [Ignavibacteria bacterium]
MQRITSDVMDVTKADIDCKDSEKKFQMSAVNAIMKIKWHSRTAFTIRF